MDLLKSSEKTFPSLLSATPHSKQTEKSCWPFGTGKESTARFNSSLPLHFKTLVDRSFKSMEHWKNADFVKWGARAISHILFPSPTTTLGKKKMNCYYIKKAKNLFQIASNQPPLLFTPPPSAYEVYFF